MRFYFVYPGRKTTVPDYIKALPDYHETRGKSEGKPTSFADWSHPELKRFTLEFYEKLAAALRSTTLGWLSSRRGSASGPSITSTTGR